MRPPRASPAARPRRRDARTRRGDQRKPRVRKVTGHGASGRHPGDAMPAEQPQSLGAPAGHRLDRLAAAGILRRLRRHADQPARSAGAGDQERPRDRVGDGRPRRSPEAVLPRRRRELRAERAVCSPARPCASRANATARAGTRPFGFDFTVAYPDPIDPPATTSKLKLGAGRIPELSFRAAPASAGRRRHR